MIISQGDLAFLKSAMHRLNIRKPIRVYRSTSKKKHPDIWTITDGPFGEIWVTDEWARQNVHERRKRILHECYHHTGLEHGTYDGLEYSTYPDKDTFSMAKYREIIGKKNPDFTLGWKGLIKEKRRTYVYYRDTTGDMERGYIAQTLRNASGQPVMYFVKGKRKHLGDGWYGGNEAWVKAHDVMFV